jgi:DNA helicase-2/ATP-dependent DNA helicase PcrA
MLEEACAAAPDGKDPRALFDELFTDRHWLANGLADHGPGAFLPGEIRTIHRWCTDLHGARFDQEADGNRFCGYDAEDEMILLRMFQCMRGNLRFSAREALEYAHVFVDEAQDFSPLELLVLHDTAKEKSLTLAGDTAQQIQNANTFSDWTEVLGALGGDSLAISPLNISYRATAEIMGVAHQVLGPIAPPALPQSPRSGAPVELLQFGGMGEALTWLADALGDLADREPRAGVAILCRFAHQADEAYRVLERCDLDRMHRIREQDFAFAPGIEITDVAQTKGLEFDYVVILHADAETWPETDTSRRLLHVALTRAAHQAWLISWGRPSPILPDSLRTREMY